MFSALNISGFEEGGAWGEEVAGDIKADVWGKIISGGDDDAERFLPEGQAGVSTPILPALPFLKTRVLEALTSYPISSEVMAGLERQDVCALALSCRAMSYYLNLGDPVSRHIILSRCVGRSHGPDTWGQQESVSAPHQKEDGDSMQEGTDINFQAWVRTTCWDEVCKFCRQPPPIGTELRRRWICGSCLPGRLSGDMGMPLCSCGSAGDIFCLDCVISMLKDDNNYYDLSEDSSSGNVAVADPSLFDDGKGGVHYFSCWDCEETVEPPYDGVFICRWCSGRLS